MSGWEKVDAGRLMVRGTESIDPRKFSAEAFDLLSIPAFDAGKPEITVGSAIGSAKQLVQAGDVLLSKIVPHIRRAWIVGVNRGRRQIASGEWIVFRSDLTDAGYLRHALVANEFHAKFMSTVSGVGGSLLRARPAHVATIKIALPPLPEQRRIAEVLDRAETLRAQRRQALAQLNALTEAIFLDMFGDPAIPSENWPVRPIGQLLESASYGTSEKAGSVGTFAVLRMGNITSSGSIDLSNLKYMDLAPSDHARYLVQRGDILFNRTNSPELVGKSALVRSDQALAYAGYLVRLRVNALNDPEYLAAFLNCGYAKRMLRCMCKSIVGMANINATEIQAMRIAQPPLALQREFALRIDRVECLKVAHQASLAELNALFTSLQHRAFRGEL